MLPFRKIIFPVDYSDACRSIVPFVRSAVEHFQAQLTLIHAYGPEGLSFIDLPIASPDLPQKVREFEQLRVRDFAQEVFPGIQVDTFAELGEAGGVIHNNLKHQGGDLIMLPTHGRGPVRRLMLGSVTTKVLHDVDCAVWTATATAIASHGAQYRTIVCAIDDSDEARSVLTAGAALAASYRAELAVVHVLGLPPMSMEVDYAAIRNDLLEGARQKLRETLAAMNISAAHHAVIEGNITSGLHDWVAEHKGDLLITGRGHAQGGLGRVWSNLYSIVRESPCPVISI
ncbi:MAG: universal stress protein, partial [Acidobacteriota bacterium]